MHDDLPGPFDKLKRQPAPRALRGLVLTAVERELKRRTKPRWERVLEWSVAASFVLGIGLNAEMLIDGARGIALHRAQRGVAERQNPQVAQESTGSHGDVELGFPRSGNFDEDYAKLLARLSEPSAG